MSKEKNFGYDLDPCPFCGGEAQLHKVDPMLRYSHEETGFVRCTKCEIEQGYSYPLDEAVERWNTRHA